MIILATSCITYMYYVGSNYQLLLIDIIKVARIPIYCYCIRITDYRIIDQLLIIEVISNNNRR